MGTAVASAGIDFQVSDVSGQKKVKVSSVSPGATVREIISGLLDRMRLPRNDSSGRPVNYRARSERRDTYLQDNETVGGAVEPGDEIILQPNIDAGAGR
jgi:hypothetical protein